MSAHTGVHWASTPHRPVRATWGMSRALLLGVALLTIGLGSQGFSSAAGASSPSVHYDAVYRGDATGRTNVTSSLRGFLQKHNGQRVALARNGVYRVTSLGFTARGLTVDFRGARLVGYLRGAPGILRLATARNVVLNDPYAVGTGYRWAASLQNEHGIWIDGGSDITINRPVTRDVHGDGIYVSYQPGKNSPAVRVRIRNPDIKRASRNGIAPVAGQVTVTGGHIDHVGIVGIDFEVNDVTGAHSVVGVVDGVDIRHHGEFPGHSSDYAIAAAGYTRATKQSIKIQNVTGDKLTMTIWDTATVLVRNNHSSIKSRATFPGSDTVSFARNKRIVRS